MHAACLFAFVVGVSPVADRRMRRALLRPHVRDHRLLSPLLLAQVVQDLARRAVPVRRARRLGRAARPDLVGRASSRSPPVFRQEGRRALADPARLRARAHELVPVEERLRARPQARARPHELPRAALARPLRHHRAGVARAWPCSVLGVALEKWAPGLGTNGWQMLIWGFFVSTVLTSHGTYTINSLSHVFGKQRYKTGDSSRNNWFLALITLGEGWHNNHHHYPSSTRQGFYWWEIDITYYLLKVMSWMGIIWDSETGARLGARPPSHANPPSPERSSNKPTLVGERVAVSSTRCRCCCPAPSLRTTLTPAPVERISGAAL